MKNKRSKINKKTIRYMFIVVLLLLLILIAYLALKILESSDEYAKGTSTYEEIKTIAVKNNDLESPERIDFESLKTVNSDIVGWLSLENTVIDYPVVKGIDNDYYLNHLYTGEWNSLGTLFVDFRNRDLFEDQVSVIYGHSMLNGSMFFLLERYEKQSFYEEHKEFIFQSPGKTYVLEPIAGKTVDAKVPFLQFNFDSEMDYAEYIEDFISHSTFKSEANFVSSDKTVMMIKCSDDFEDARYVLICKVSEQ